MGGINPYGFGLAVGGIISTSFSPTMGFAECAVGIAIMLASAMRERR